MDTSIKMEVWGSRAFFASPESKPEAKSFDAMTPSAAKGILESIYWHPGMRWIVDKIHVLNEINTTTLKRNELSSKINSKKFFTQIEENDYKNICVNPNNINQLRSYTILTDVRYVIEAHFEMTENKNASDSLEKFKTIFLRRLRKGQCFRNPYLGCKEFFCYFQECTENPKGFYSESGEIDLGNMLYGIDYSDLKNKKPIRFHAIMENGVIDLSKYEVRYEAFRRAG